MSPPIREAGHNKALQAALSSGILQVTRLNLESHLNFLKLEVAESLK